FLASMGTRIRYFSILGLKCGSQRGNNALRFRYASLIAIFKQNNASTFPFVRYVYPSNLGSKPILYSADE
ncbi:hypothetical protein AB4Z22_45465, partial [Paenibacillus sp. TAF58]